MRRTATVTVLFCDLVGSTERQRRLGDDAADEFRNRFFGALADVVRETDGELVKNTGDGLMVVFRSSAVDAVTAASRMHDQVEALDAEDPAYLRAGIAAGEAAFEDDDWFGMPVVEAARLCAAAADGQTLVSEVVRSLVGSRGGHQFRKLGALSLKGRGAPVPAAAVIRTPVAAHVVAPTPHRRRVWPIVAAPIAVAAAGVALALVVRSGSGSARSTPAARGYVPRYEVTACSRDQMSMVPDGTCGDLVVPQDRTKPNGRWLRLPVWRVPARAPGARATDPTIDVGAFGILEDPAKSPARDHSALVLFGTRASDKPDAAMACPEFDPTAADLLGGPFHNAATAARGAAALKACSTRLTKSGIDLARYTYVDAGDDVVDLMRALHFDHVNLGAELDDIQAAFEVARVAPRAVRTLTLQNPIAAGFGGDADPVAELTRAFDHYVTLCHADPKCAAAYPDLEAKVRGNDRTYDHHPTTLDVTAIGRHVRVRLDADHTIGAIANALGDRAAVGLLAAGITAPPPALVAQLIAAYDFPWVLPHYPLATYLSTTCSYDNYTLSAARDLSRQTRPELAGIDDGTLQWECAAWPVPQGPDPMFTDFVSAVPVLIVQGDLSYTSTPEGTAHLQSGLSNSTLLLFSTLGNGTGGSGLLADGVPKCLNDLRRTFLTDPARHLDAAGCTKQSPPIDFVTSSH
ncbi:MAG TPA: adenylate/guanylate cyclase domain-containing protein [Acidimicrobiia bacterium]|nr:adenylate/guanylate cyclase domain-containing protein [Acidimicrobiia bacterium]